MDDIENEDLKELEYKLYSQVHHGTEDGVFNVPVYNAAPVRTVTQMSVSNIPTNKCSRDRYWNKNISNTGNVCDFGSSSTHAVPQDDQFVIGNTADAKSATTEGTNSPLSDTKESELKPECSMTTSGEIISTGVIPVASGGDPEKIRSSNITQEKHCNPDKGSQSNNENARLLGVFARNIAKLNKAKKYRGKRIRAKMAREKKKNFNTETVVLVSSSDEDNDVIEVPLTPPPMVVIDSSDEEEKPDIKIFAKPNKIDDQQQEEHHSRCNSPSSAISDDFIGQIDKTRLLNEPTGPIDEELECAHDAPNFSSTPLRTKLNAISGGTDSEITMTKLDFATPKTRVSSSTQDTDNYRVTHSNFRAVDVYESESSDMPENVYEKGNTKETRNASSSSDVEEIEAAAKTKKLRKRKASGSFKGSEPNDNSTDSEDNATEKGPAFISRGEAVENYRQKHKRRSLSNRADINTSDVEFINKLSDIVHGNHKIDNDQNSELSSNNSGENITARHIAEDVLKKSAKGKQPTKNSAGENDESAVPSNVSMDLEELFSGIDNISTKIDDYEETIYQGPASPYNADNSVSLVDLESEADPNKYERIIHSNRNHIAWTDEMKRFYNNSWGQENFNVKQILKTMNPRANWKIRMEDRFPRGRKFTNLKCLNCCEFGHTQARCPLPKKDLICYICGEVGHREPRCPNTLCLRCGKKSNTFTRSCKNCINQNRLICPVCKIRGHGIDLCPDKWRRYHSTTIPNEHPTAKVEYKGKKFCCICAKKGHLPEYCRSCEKFNEYHLPVTEIKSHAKSYPDIPLKDTLTRDVISYNLLCEPDDNLTFDFTVNAKTDGYYNRFLSSVGLEGIYNKRKRSQLQNMNEGPERKIKKKNLVINPFAKNKDDVEKLKSNAGKSNQVSTTDSMDTSEENIFKSPAAIDVSHSNCNEVESSTETTSVQCEVQTEQDKQDTKMTSQEIENSESQNEKCDIKTKKDDLKHIEDKDVISIDSDSNYSFSEHFAEESSSTNKKRVRELGPLPDFIPLLDSDDSFDEDCDMPQMISKSNRDDESKQSKEMSCEAKIYLSKFHSKFLLSPDGNKFLIENSKKFDVKTSIDWTSVGNVLIIEGLQRNQDKFHKELQLIMLEVSDQTNRKALEQSQKVPRKRLCLVEFVQGNLLQLEKYLGNVDDLNRRLKNTQNQTSKSSWKAAERTRKSLNMILMGQGGLRDGKMHLEALQKNLKILLDDTSELCPKDLRDEINLHWKYIFSSTPHDNYDKLIQQYTELKKSDRLPKLSLNYKLLGKNPIDVKFTKGQTMMLTKETSIRLVKDPKLPVEEKKYENVSQTSDKSMLVLNPMSLKNKNKSQQQIVRPLVAPPPPPFARRPADKIVEVHDRWESNCDILLTELSGSSKPNQVQMNQDEGKRQSLFWSRECIKFIDKCKQLCENTTTISNKLTMVSEKAKNGLLSYNDFRALGKIYSSIQHAKAL